MSISPDTGSGADTGSGVGPGTGADPGGGPRTGSGLRANRDFQVVLGGQAVSALGDAISLTAMPLLVLYLTGSGALMGVVGALQLVPDLVLGLLAGALADRWDRRRMMIWSDAGRAVLTAAIPLAAWLGLPAMTVILVVTLPVNALRVLSDSAFTSSVPSLVGREHLGRANGYLEATLSVPFIVGPAIAGVLVATIGAADTIAIDAASFAVSALSLLLVRRRLRAERPAELPHILADVRDGVRFVWRHTALRALISYWSVIGAATAALIPALGYYLTVDRGHGPQLFGFVGSAWSVGYLLGSLLAGRLDSLDGRRVGPRMLVCGGTIGALLAAIAITPVWPLYLVAAFFIGAALAVLLISYLTLRSSITPDDLLGRVGSTARTVSAGLQPLGMLAGGALISAASAGAALTTMGLTALAATLLFALTPAFRTRAAAA
jgi:MFS family permease